ncbi:hypothetical protein L2E82_46806 [Cichorium intybus]|uniref:Uncharacterized protein n=1 Tax=Cichorium intybus TaxID=13427 RepID=A0ACB8YU22_CICIN|nr:hypothetical protein L2E82_46806 [Cichorium intybus]
MGNLFYLVQVDQSTVAIKETFREDRHRMEIQERRSRYPHERHYKRHKRLTIPCESTFLGLDDNILSQWDMRDRRRIVQNIAQSNSPILNSTKGHHFSRGTKFQCFATTSDGCIVDVKIRLYSTTSMRQAKTAFPGLGSPITHVDVTYDGKWILGTTDTYLILISALFTDKDGKLKTGFSGRMGNKTPASRLLKLTPVDSHTARKQNKFLDFRSRNFSS